MKTNHINLFLIFIVLFNSCKGQALNYKDSLTQAIGKIEKGDSIASNEINLLIPSTEKEYLLLYSLTNPDSGTKIDSYYKLINHFFVSSKTDESICKKMLELSKFVDGEFAESYFEEIESIAEKNTKIFCNSYEKADSKKISRLTQIYENNCKQ